MLYLEVFNQNVNFAYQAIDEAALLPADPSAPVLLLVYLGLLVVAHVVQHHAF